jgi:hypothetical protein
MGQLPAVAHTRGVRVEGNKGEDMRERREAALPAAQADDTLVLVNKDMVTAPGAGTWLLLMLAFAGSIVFILAVSGNPPDVGWMEALARLWAKVDWGNLLASVRISLTSALGIGMMLAFILFTDRQKRLERLILSPEGIRYVSPFPEVLKRFVPDWSLAWTQVRAIEIGVPALVHPSRRNNPQFVLMSFLGGNETQRISPLRWVDPDHYSPWGNFKNAFRMTWGREADADVRQAVSASEVGRYLAAKQPQIRLNWNMAAVETMTSLERNRHGRMAMALLAVLLVYTFADLVFGPESYIDLSETPNGLYAATGIVAAALAALWLSRSTLKSAEKGGLAILLGAVTALAMIPGALRINQFAGGNALVTYPCRVIQAGDAIILQPLAPGVPRITYFANNEYWAKFGKDDLYPVQIRKGILGFYQFNSAAITARINHDQ